ncbi:MAG: SEL1-like repeat protein [Planctomycetes bacterium]|nr:SEL1-like repeat protein [Planctomycetota bacterium]
MAGAADDPLSRGHNFFTKGKYKEAAAAFEVGVAEGNAACMDYLGFLYLEGLGKKPSAWIAQGFFRKGAERGSDQACRNLGNMYFDGRGVQPDLVEAARWWEKSAKLGKDPRPLFSLGQLYLLEEGDPTYFADNTDLAREYWERARKLGSDDAVVALAALDLAEDKLGTRAEKAVKALADKGHTTAAGLVCFMDMEKAAPKTLIKDISFVFQAHNFCGVASSTMLLRHQGLNVSQYDVARKRFKHQWGQGSRWTELTWVAGKFEKDWKITSFPDTDEGFASGKKQVISLLEKGSPVIIDILEHDPKGSAHSILVCGHDPKSGQLLVRNPALPYPGFQAFSEQRWKETWRSIGFIPSNNRLLRPMMYAVDKSEESN